MQADNNSAATPDNAEAEAQQYLIFQLKGKSYGLPILNIREIIEYGELTDMPMMPEFIAGVINLRGRVVPIIDLGQRFSGVSCEIGKRTSIVILEVSNDDLILELGIIVDMVNDVLSLAAQDIEPAPALGEQINTRFISGMAKINDKLLILLDVENVLSIDELSLVGNLPAKVQ